MNNYIGKKVYYYKKIDSTQKEIWRRVKNNNIENGSVVIADIQTDAIGTHGRKWYTDKIGNIAFSLVIFPNISIKNLDNLTLKIAEIFIEIFKEIYDINVSIKSPNDLIVNSKKIGGILTETKLLGDIVKYLVIGVGINTNNQIINDEIKEFATSIKTEFNTQIDNYKVINKFCERLEEYLEEIF